MTGLDTLRERMAAYLQAQGLRAVTAWPHEKRLRRDGAVVAVSLRSCAAGPSGFKDYLGERYNDESQSWEELYGKKAEVEFGLDLYATQNVGAAELQTAFDRLANALQAGTPEGLAVKTFSCGETTYDQSEGLFKRTAQVVCTAYLYAVCDEGGTFTDFEVRGVQEK